MVKAYLDALPDQDADGSMAPVVRVLAVAGLALEKSFSQPGARLGLGCSPSPEEAFAHCGSMTV